MAEAMGNQAEVLVFLLAFYPIAEAVSNSERDIPLQEFGSYSQKVPMCSKISGNTIKE